MANALFSDPVFERAVRAHQTGRLAEAEHLYRQLLGQAPGHPGVGAQLGLLLGQLARFGEAEELLRNVVRRAPDRPDGHANLASVLHDQNKFAAAIECCETGLRRSPGHRKLLNTLASSLGGAGRLDDALALLTGMVRAHPRYAQGWRNIGALHVRQGRCDEAVAAFDRAAAIDPLDIACHVEAGECLMVHGRAADALTRLERALRLDGYDVRALALKTLALASLGREDDERWLADPERLVHRHRLAELGAEPEQVRALNMALSEFAVREPSMREDPPEYATKNGMHTTRNLAEYDDPAIAELKRFIQHACDRRMASLAAEDPAHPFVRAAPQNLRLDLWSVRLRAGGNMLPHIHTDGWLSGVYYVDVPSVVDDPQAGGAGWLKVGTPRIDIPVAHAPMVSAVKPEPGLMLTFPSYLWHDTVPLPANLDGHRVVYAYDLCPVRGGVH